MNSISLEPPQHPSLPRSRVPPASLRAYDQSSFNQPYRPSLPYPSLLVFSLFLPSSGLCCSPPATDPGLSAISTNQPRSTPSLPRALFSPSHSRNYFFPPSLSFVCENRERTLNAHVTTLAHRARSLRTAFPVTFYREYRCAGANVALSVRTNRIKKMERADTHGIRQTFLRK